MHCLLNVHSVSALKMVNSPATTHQNVRNGYGVRLKIQLRPPECVEMRTYRSIACRDKLNWKLRKKILIVLHEGICENITNIQAE